MADRTTHSVFRARRRQWCGIFHYRWWTASIKSRLLFFHAGCASWGLSLSSVYFNRKLKIYDNVSTYFKAKFSYSISAPYSYKVKSRPVLHHCVVIFCWSSGIMECACVLFTFGVEFCSCARGRQWCGIIYYYWWTASIKPGLLFSRAGYASWGLSLSSVYYNPVHCPCFIKCTPFSKSWNTMLRISTRVSRLFFVKYLQYCSNHNYTLSSASLAWNTVV